MKKIIRWFNFLFFICLIFLVFLVFYFNKDENVVLNYVFGTLDLSLPTVMFFTFIFGGIFGVIVMILFGMREQFREYRKSRELKKVKKDLEQLKDQQTL